MMAPKEHSPDVATDPCDVPRPGPVRCIIGETVREIRIWTEEEWEALDPAERPSPAEYFPRLGWVAPATKRRAVRDRCTIDADQPSRAV